MSKTRSFDADAQTRELLEAPVTIGEQTFYPARLTPDVRREQIEIATRGARAAREAGLGQDPGPDGLTSDQLDKRADAVGQIDEGVNLQLCVLLRDENKQPPTPDFLNDHLDNRVATRLLNWLLEDQGEAEPATIPAATST